MGAGFEINAIALIFMITSFVSLALAFISLYRSDIAGIRYITFMSLLVFIWSFSNALEFATSDIQLKILFTKFSYLGITPAPLTLLVFAAKNTGLTQKIPLRYFHALYAIPLIIIVLAFTNDYHFFQWQSYRIIDGIYGKSIYYESGIGLWVLVVFSWTAFMIAMYLMIDIFRKRHERYNRPLILLILAFTWPWIANFLYVSRLLPHPEIDWTPVAYLLTAIFLYISVNKYNLFELAPLAKDLLYSSIQNPVVVVNNKKIIIDYNQEAKHHFELIQQIGTDISDSFPELNLDYFDKGQYDKIPIKRGVERFELHISEIRHDKKELEGYLLLFNDVTREAQQHEELKKSKEELQILNDSKDKLFSIIAHDLRNPFNGIIGLSQILTSTVSISEDERKRALETINSTAVQTYSLLENLLAWAKAQTNSVTFSPSWINLRDVVNISIGETLGNARLKSILLQSHIPESGLVFADKNMLNAILRNLIANAIKFTPKSGKVSVIFSEDERQWVLAVRDNGIGIEPSRLPDLLNIGNFHSNPGTDNENGTGLGLIICKDFVEKHGGRLWVESKLGSGTTFYFSLPKTDSPATQVPSN